MTGSRRRAAAIRTFAVLAGLLLLPLAGNWPRLVLGISSDPLLPQSGLGFGFRHGPVGGRPSLDPNDGITTQALGRLAADDWLAGRAPWWNPYDGAGLPLAAEGQNPALFLPFVLLLRLPEGMLLLALSMQAIAGASTFALLRRLRLSLAAAGVGAGLFALNGTFAWFAHGPSLPIAFAPLLLLGVERASEAAAAARGGGWRLAAAAVALSLYAAFPETAYLDGLLAAAWAAARISGMPRAGALRMAGKLAAAVGTGLLLAAPQVVVFAQFLAGADVGIHEGGLDGLSAPTADLATTFTPYIFGSLQGFIRADPSDPDYWLQTYLGGYVTSGAICLAAAALAARGAPERGLRWMLAGCCVAVLGASYVPVVRQAVGALPLMGGVQVFRYGAPCWELSIAILAAMAVDDWQRGRSRRAAAWIAAPVAAAAVLWFAWRPLASLWSAFPAAWGWSAASAAAAAVVWSALGLLLSRPAGAARVAAATAIVLLEAVALFSIPRLAGLRGGELDLPAVAWLAERLGLQRAYALGPLAPNYGAWFHVATLNADYLPAPRLWADDEAGLRRRASSPAAAVARTLEDEGAEVLAHRTAYADRGVAYVLVPPGSDLLSAGATETRRQGAARPTPLWPGQSYTTRAGAPPRPLVAVSVEIGTYQGASDGSLRLTVCSGGECSDGEAPLAGAADDAPLRIELGRPLTPRDGGVELTFRHTGGQVAVAIWVDEAGAPRLRLFPAADPGAPKLVYRGVAADIYALASPAPYFEAPGCTLVAEGRVAATAICLAPSALIRREMLDSGWTATVDGRPAPVGLSPPLFQTVALPAGASRVAFAYRPPHLAAAACALAAGAILMAAGMRRSRAP